MNYLARIMIGLCLVSATAAPALAASTKQEIQELRKQMEALQQGQEDMQKDLAEIKRLLGQRAPAAPAAPTFQAQDVSIGPSPYLGNADATVTLIEYSDYQCPFCARHYRDVMPTLVAEYVDTGKLKYVMRENPISSLHPNAFNAALAALCAGDQGQYWEMSALLFDNQRQLDVENIKKLAETLPITPAQFNACLDNKAHEKMVNDDLASASALGVQGTPGFVLGLTDADDPNTVKALVYIRGAQSLENFKRAIDGLLDEAD